MFDLKCAKSRKKKLQRNVKRKEKNKIKKNYKIETVTKYKKKSDTKKKTMTKCKSVNWLLKLAPWWQHFSAPHCPKLCPLAITLIIVSKYKIQILMQNTYKQ